MFVQLQFIRGAAALKCWFCYNSGMRRPISQETTTTEKIVHYPQLPREEGMPHLSGATRATLGQSRGRGSDGDMWTRAFTVVSSGRNGRGRISRFRIVCFEELQWVLGYQSCAELYDIWVSCNWARRQ